MYNSKSYVLYFVVIHLVVNICYSFLYVNGHRVVIVLCSLRSCPCSVCIVCIVIGDCAKDGGKEFFTKMPCVL